MWPTLFGFFFVVVVFLVGRNEGDWAGKGRANVKRRRGTGRHKKIPLYDRLQH